MGAETLAILGTAAAVAGAGTAAYSAVKQGEAQKNAADYQAKVDQNNAQIASWNADIAEQNNAQKTQAIERMGSLREGTQRAFLGAAGVGVDSGSSADVLNATTEDTNRSAATQAYQGELTGYGYRSQQQNFLDQSTMSTATGANALSAGYVGAGASLLSGAGQVANKWYDFKVRQGYGGNTGTGAP